MPQHMHSRKKELGCRGSARNPSAGAVQAARSEKRREMKCGAGVSEGLGRSRRRPQVDGSTRHPPPDAPSLKQKWKIEKAETIETSVARDPT